MKKLLPLILFALFSCHVKAQNERQFIIIPGTEFLSISDSLGNSFTYNVEDSTLEIEGDTVALLKMAIRYLLEKKPCSEVILNTMYAVSKIEAIREKSIYKTKNLSSK